MSQNVEGTSAHLAPACSPQAHKGEQETTHIREESMVHMLLQALFPKRLSVQAERSLESCRGFRPENCCVYLGCNQFDSYVSLPSACMSSCQYSQHSESRLCCTAVNSSSKRLIRRHNSGHIKTGKFCVRAPNKTHLLICPCDARNEDLS